MKYLINLSKILKTTAVFSMLLLGVQNLSAQPGSDIRSAAFGETKKTRKTPPVKVAKPVSKPKPVVEARSKPPLVINRKKRVSAKSVNSAAEKVMVKFTSREPLVEVWLNNRYIGLTDSKLEIKSEIAPGNYNLMAKSKQRVMLPTKKITISETQNTFKLYSDVLPEVKILVQNPEKIDEENLTDDQKQEILTEKVKQIIENYKDPVKADSLTAEDWQIVYQSAELRQLKGYNAVQVESYRWFASGMLEMINQRYEGAVTAFSEARKYWKDSPYPDYEIGNAYLANKRTEEAARIYLKVLQSSPKMAAAYKKLGDAYRLLERDKEAISAYRNAIQYGYTTPETSLWLGKLLLDSKQTEEGLKILEDVAREKPSAEVFVSIAQGYEKLKRSVSAIEFYEKAIQIDENNAEAHYKLAEILYEQREYDKAKINFDKALALDAEGKKINIKEAQKKSKEAASKSKKK